MQKEIDESIPDNKPHLVNYYFNQQADDRWMIYDEHGSGDKLLDTDTFRRYIQPHLTYLGQSVTLDHIYKTINQRVEIKGFGVVCVNIHLHEKDGKLDHVNLGTIVDEPIKKRIRQFRLTLPHFKGTPWPYTQKEMEEEIDK